MESHLIRRLDGTGVPAREVGGKAAALDRLVGMGFPVPRAVALTADAYRAFVERAGLAAMLDELLHTDLPAAGSIERETDRVDAAFVDGPMPETLESLIREGARDLLTTGPVAVRSSATAEDLAAASFAGQYRTFLDVKTEDDLLDAVRRCWASLWGPAVRAYRRREEVPEDDLAMGVIVQQMVPAEHAGVLFTRDPQGDPAVLRIEVVEGLGESLVSGEVTPEDYRVDRGTLTIRPADDGEPPRWLEELARLGLRIERRFGAPQDVEWARADGRLFVLQTRPITIQGAFDADDDGFDTPPEPGHTYTSSGVQEMLPGVVPPLLWTINAPMLDDAFRRLFGDLGLSIPRTSGPVLAIGRFRGRAALDLSVLRESAATMPGGSAAEVERQYLGRALTAGAEERAAPGGRLARARAGVRAIRVRRRVEDEVAILAEAVRYILALGVSIRTLPVQRLLSYRSRVRDLAWRGYAAEVAAAAGAAAAYRALEMALERWVGEEAAGWAQRITAGPGPGQQAGTNCATELWDLYAHHAERPVPCEVLVGETPEEVERKLAQLGRDGEELVELVRRTARHFGSKAIYGGPTWDEDAGMVWDCVATMARCHEASADVDPDPKMARVRAAREEAFEELKRRLRSSWRWRLTRVLTGQVVDVRFRLLRKLAGDATRFLSLREEAKAALLVLGGEERRIIQEATRRLERSGLLASADDVLLLADHELEQMLAGDEPVSGEEIARRRNALRRAEAADPLPEIFEGRPGALDELPEITGDLLEGWAASPGRARGPARVLRSLAEGSELQSGEIIVARSTDPSWTPLFLVAGGIVLEEGGPLSHAAIVAREFGLPAVLNVKGAVRAIETGEEIEVNGSAGTVTRSGAREPAEAAA